MNLNFFKQKFGSRKFWVLLAAIFGYSLLALSGQISWESAFASIKPIALGWLVIEGFVDGMRLQK